MMSPEYETKIVDGDKAAKFLEELGQVEHAAIVRSLMKTVRHLDEQHHEMLLGKIVILPQSVEHAQSMYALATIYMKQHSAEPPGQAPKDI